MCCNLQRKKDGLYCRPMVFGRKGTPPRARQARWPRLLLRRGLGTAQGASRCGEWHARNEYTAQLDAHKTEGT